MECAFEQFIEEIKEFLRETNQLSKDVEEHLRSYSGMQALKKFSRTLLMEDAKMLWS